MLKRSYNSFIFACRGVKTTWKEEHQFRIEISATVLVFLGLFYFHFTLLESALCVFAITLVLSAEIINTALEDLCNKVEPHHDTTIGKIKDTAGAFVMVTVIGAVIVGLLVFYNHFLSK
ncbi:MAG: diacylglycerol kinase family protein [Nitrospira sp.]